MNSERLADTQTSAADAGDAGDSDRHLLAPLALPLLRAFSQRDL